MKKDKICIICEHKLNHHIDDGDVYRCHALSTDSFQCECRIQKKIHKLKDLDKHKRIKEAIKKYGLSEKNNYGLD